MTKKKFIISGAATALVALAIVATSLLTVLNPVSAEELTQQSLDKISQLSPSELHQLDMRVNGDPISELEAAKQAKDLKVLTVDEYNKLSAQDNQFSTQAAPGAPAGSVTSIDTTVTKYFRYTDSTGAVHTIGVDKAGLPVIIMVFRNSGDGSSQGSVMIQASGSGQMVSGSASTGPMPAGATGMTSCASTSGGQTKCTNSDGSAAPTPNCHTEANGAMTCSGSATTTEVTP